MINGLGEFNYILINFSLVNFSLILVMQQKKGLPWYFKQKKIELDFKNPADSEITVYILLRIHDHYIYISSSFEIIDEKLQLYMTLYWDLILLSNGFNLIYI